jgi:4-hydroxy-3-polyprenylbenzoate decarboxylase
VPPELTLPTGFAHPRVVVPGVLAIAGPACPAPSFDYDVSRRAQVESRSELTMVIERFCHEAASNPSLKDFRWIVIVDDSQFVAESLRNFLWTTFTRTDPATDLHGIESFVTDKHWGCRGPLVFDARVKPHHAPLLEEPPEITRRVEALAVAGKPLHGIL